VFVFRVEKAFSLSTHSHTHSTHTYTHKFKHTNSKTYSVGVDGTSHANNVAFRFDKAFAATQSQAAVFSELQPLIQSACDGKNVTIFG
jgi:hypothetical protein